MQSRALFLAGTLVLKGMALDPTAAPAQDEDSTLPRSSSGHAMPSRLTPLSPAEAARTFTVPDDLEIEQVLAEPVITQPVFLNFDERGRMWVVEYRQYPAPAGLKVVSRDKFWRAVYDKVPEPPPRGVRGRDRISIHEDTDGDGTFDKHKTFVDGLNIATSCVKGRGGVWVLNPPYLLFYPDQNNDDVPDGDPVVHLAGFGFEDTHSVVNSLRWGPDGWLYAAQGSTVTANVRVVAPGSRDTNRVSYSQGQNIWRYHPEKHIYEIFAEGGGNAFGVEFDDKGRLFSGHNGGDTRGFHYMQGAYLRKGFEKHGELSNPYAFGYFPQMDGTKGERFTHNFIIYHGGALPLRYEGKLFGVEPLQGRVVLSEITPDGSTFKTRDLERVVTSSDSWFRPVDIKAGPDGAIYIADWYDRQVTHTRNQEGNIDPSNGRIYRLKKKGAKPTKLPDLAKLSASELVVRIRSTNQWERESARRILTERPAKEWEEYRSSGRLAFVVAKSNAPASIESLWALWCSGHLAGYQVYRFWENKELEPVVRVWSLRFFGDRFSELDVPYFMNERPASIYDYYVSLELLAKVENNVEVRTQLACTAKRLPAAAALPIVRNLILSSTRGSTGHWPVPPGDPPGGTAKASPAKAGNKGEEARPDLPVGGSPTSTGESPVPPIQDDSRDPRLPLLLWWAIESKCESDRDAVLKLFEDSTLWNRPIVEQHILGRLMRRFAAAGTRPDLQTCAKLLNLSPSREHSVKLMAGFEEAFKGRSLAGLPDELITAMARHRVGSDAFRLRQGKPEAVGEALKIIANATAKKETRLQFIQILGEVKQSGAVQSLLVLLISSPDHDLRKATLTSLLAYDSPVIGSTVVELYNSLTGDVRAAAQTLLASRAVWSLDLAEAVRRGRIQSADVPLDVVRSMKRHRNDSLASLIAQQWPRTGHPTSAEMEQHIKRLAEVVRGGQGNPYSGQKLFNVSCASCHTLFARGGQVGPDLTTYQRGDLDAMLLHLVNPSAEIREGYEAFLIETKDDRSLSGFLVERDAQVVVLRGPDGQNISLEQKDIVELKAAGMSLMPEGLLDNMSDQQVRDLFAYLRSTQPLAN